MHLDAEVLQIAFKRDPQRPIPFGEQRADR
jgi:hypothetical protein